MCVCVCVKVSTADHMFKCLMGLDLKACVSFSVARVMMASFMVQQTQSVLQQSFAKNVRVISCKPVLKCHWIPFSNLIGPFVGDGHVVQTIMFQNLAPTLTLSVVLTFNRVHFSFIFSNGRNAVAFPPAPSALPCPDCPGEIC